MVTINQIWISLTTPVSTNEKNARQEHMTRVIYVMVSAGLLIMSIIVPTYDFSVGEPDYTGTLLMLLADGLILAGWLLIYRGHWHISRYLLLAIFLALGGYFFFNVGLITTGVLHLAIAVMLTGMLFRSKDQWVTVIFSMVLYLTLGWLAGERNFEVFFTAGIVVGFSLSGIALLQWFFSTLLTATMERFHQAKIASRDSTEKIRAIFESINDGITITDLQGNITDVNQAVLKMHGFQNRDELIGQSAFALIAERDHSIAMENLQLTLAHGQSGLLEYTFRKKNGKEFDGELNAVLIKDEAGNPAGFVALTRDITKRKQAEVERESLISELQNKNIQAESLREITTIVAASLDVSETVRRILEQLKKVVVYDSASVWLVEGNVARIIGGDNLHPDVAIPGMKYIIDEQEPDYPLLTQDIPYLLYDDIQAHFPQFKDPVSAYIRGWMAIPLRARGKHIGSIFLDGCRVEQFTDDDAQRAVTYAEQVAIALENARLFSNLQAELAERKQAEQALKLSEEKFFKAFNTTPVLMTIEDDQHIFVDVNKAFLNTFGLSREEAIGRKASELNILYDPDDLIALRKEYQEKGVLKDFEMRMRRKSGEIGVVILSSDKFLMDDVEHTLTSGLDITDRKQAEEKYRNIFNNSIEGIFQSTEDGRFLSVNPAMARIYGYDSPEAMLQSINDITTQLYVDSKQRKDVRQRLASGERLIGYESLEYRKDGSTFWSSMSAQAIHDESGKLLYYEGTMEDITPRKQAEVEREKLIAELQSKNEELERFTYTVSHDLKAPLITVGGFLGYLEEDVRDGNTERAKQDIDRINDAIKKMNQLLNELLKLSRIGRMTNPPEDAPFEEIVREALEKVQGQLISKKVKVKVEKDLPIVTGDRTRLVEVVQNLVDNAAKFTKDQPNPKIEIGTRDEDGETIFYVKDNGIGIDPKYHKRIFGLFDKLDASSEGTGVGLALVKRIVEVHSGRIWVESEAGDGATFFFTLPSRQKTERQEP